jgi:hypothetical protein
MKKTYMIPQAQVIVLGLDMCLLSGSRTMLLFKNETVDEGLAPGMSSDDGGESW